MLVLNNTVKSMHLDYHDYLSIIYSIFLSNLIQSENAVFIMPDQYFMKTWNNPIGKRELNWSCGNLTDQIYNLDIMVRA